ncbi:SDR family oxidoreductase [Novosphingobium sp.]|uniref:SDR family oxidoreductase n=1 Tax=Novosphingobium sp. TaxID=1874826 RepID=UPI001D5F77F7|nr:SDR family oxidoreductase [Novosphingobium sp.]MBX9664286.1 SDR family oxidoreductase [Novosphingobium sp.]
MDLGLKDKVVLVTAGSQGIGLATAQGYHGEGARVAICARGADKLAAAAATMPGCLALQADVTDAAQIEAMTREVAAQLGPVDVLVVNAGGPPPGLFEDLDDAAWLNATNLTLMSAVRMTRAVLPAMRARRWGRIVIISSVGVKQPVPNLTLSNSIRMAVLGWAKTLAQQVAGDNVLINTVCPGFTRTARIEQILGPAGDGPNPAEAAMAAQIPLGRIAEAKEIAGLAVFLGSEVASYMTGTAIAVDGGSARGYA